jgi:hypothetical protein
MGAWVLAGSWVNAQPFKVLVTYLASFLYRGGAVDRLPLVVNRENDIVRIHTRVLSDMVVNADRLRTPRPVIFAGHELLTAQQFAYAVKAHAQANGAGLKL